MVESCVSKNYVVSFILKNNKGLNKNWFHEKNLQTNTLWDRFFHDSLNEFDGCGGPSHCKTIGLYFSENKFAWQGPSDRFSVGWIACCVNQKL